MADLFDKNILPLISVTSSSWSLVEIIMPSIIRRLELTGKVCNKFKNLLQLTFFTRRIFSDQFLRIPTLHDMIRHRIDSCTSSAKIDSCTSGARTDLVSSLLDGTWLLKRTFQPSLIRRKRKHGFLARIRTKDGRRILNRRRHKQRRALCA